MVESNDHVSIDLQKLADSITDARGKLGRLTGGCCIYEAPPKIRISNESLYTPKVVSIGPLHHGRKQLKVMEEYKLRYLNQFLQRTRLSTLDFLKFIKGKEVALRACYADTINYESESFVKIIFLDAVFLIEMFLRYKQLRNRELTTQIVDRVFSKPAKIKEIVFDIMLLENQLPLFILRELFEHAELEESLSGVACDFLKHYVCRDVLIDETSMPTKFSRAKHFVHLVILCLEPESDVNGTQPQTDSTNDGTKRHDDCETAPNVTILHQCGIHLKPVSTNNFLDIRFSKGTLEVPKLTITNMTIHLLRNLHVFEYLHCDTNSINDYHVLLHRLLSTPEDVELLIQAGVIENRVLDSEGVSTLFRELSRDARVNFEHFKYSGIVKDLRAYTRSKRHKWIAILRQKHFSNPWVIASVIAASMIVVLTLLQTIFSGIGLRK